MTTFEEKFQPIVISQSQYDEIMKSGGASLDWDGSPIIWDQCNIDEDGTVLSGRDCDTCRFKNINQFWGCCK